MKQFHKHSWAREFIWRPDSVTLNKFRELELLAEGLHQDDPNAIALQDEMRCLAGFPQEAQLWDIITIIPSTTAYSFNGRTH